MSKKRVLIGAAMMWMAAMASAANLTADDMAREALKNQDFVHASQYAKQAIAEDGRSALNWYRLSLASFRLGDRRAAADAIRQAKTIDPTLSFASTPSRVEKLEQSIAQMGGILPPDLSTDAAAGDDAIRQELAVMSKAITQASKEVADLRQETSKTAAKNTVEPLHLAMYLALMLASGLMLGFVGDKVIIAYRNWKQKDRSARPLKEVVEELRDDTARLVQRLEIHGHQNTELHSVASKLLPALEREAGRTAVNVRKQTTGVALEDIAVPLQERAPVLGTTSPRDLHKSVTARIVERSLTNQKAA